MFDFVITSARKPNFFTDQQNLLQYKDFNGLNIEKNYENNNKGYIKANYRIIQTYVRILARNPQLEAQIAYFGDNYFSDCMLSCKLRSWDVYYVQEELYEERKKESSDLVPYRPVWGSYFEHGQADSKPVITYWYNVFTKTCKGVVARVDSDLMSRKFWPDTSLTVFGVSVHPKIWPKL